MPEASTATTTGATPGAAATAGAGGGTAADAAASQQRDAATAGGTGGADDDDQGLGAGGQSALEKERAARREAERVAREATAALRTVQEKDLPEAERTSRRLADLEQQSRSWQVERAQMRTEIEVARHATRLGFRDPGDAFALLDDGAIERDADGRPLNIEQALKDLIKAKPYLRATATTGGADQGTRSGGGNGAGADAKPSDMNDWLRSQVRARRGQTPEVTGGG